MSNEKQPTVIFHADPVPFEQAAREIHFKMRQVSRIERERRTIDTVGRICNAAILLALIGGITAAAISAITAH